MNMIITILCIVVCVLLFSVAIFIHELGHFIAARALGIAVDAFSIGMGPVLWKKMHNGVEWRISAIPFGGYVSIPQVDPEGTKKLQGTDAKDGEGGTAEDAPSKAVTPPPADLAAPLTSDIPAWKAIVVAVAGPLGNLVLAVVLAIALACIPGAHFGEMSSEIGDVVPDGPAAKAGMLPGDIVTTVNGNAVKSWSDMQTEVQIAGGKEAVFGVLRGGTNAVLRLTPDRDTASGAYFIMALSTTNHAKAAAWMPARNPLRQLEWDAMSIARILKALVTPREAKSAAKALGGPVMIAEGLYRQVRRNFWDALGFLRFLCVNLAILNLLPIPGLDGGLVLFALYELLMRRKVPPKLSEWVTKCFMYLLIALMLLLVWRDSVRSYRIHTASDECQKEETPAK